MNIAYPEQRTRSRFMMYEDAVTHVQPESWYIPRIEQLFLPLMKPQLFLPLPKVNPLLGKVISKQCEIYNFKITRIFKRWNITWVELRHDLHGVLYRNTKTILAKDLM